MPDARLINVRGAQHQAVRGGAQEGWCLVGDGKRDGDIGNYREDAFDLFGLGGKEIR